MALLTTVIPVYNGEKYLAATLESIARQTRRPDRVIVEDNCSTDRTREIVAEFKSLGFECHCNEEHVEAVDNFNRACAHALETDYLHLVCADDLIHPSLFERMLPILEPVPGRALAYSAFDIIDEEGKPVAASAADLVCYVPVTADGCPYPVSLKDYLARQADLRTVLLPGAVFKTCRQPIPFGFSKEHIYADVMFFTEWGLLCDKIIEVPQILSHYRRHSSSATSVALRSPKAAIDDEWRLIDKITSLTPMSPLGRWLKRQRNLCYLSARSYVKAQMATRERTHTEQDIKLATLQYASPLHWFLGGLAVRLRDLGKTRR